MLPEYVLEEFSRNMTFSYNKQFSAVKNKNIKKLNKLKSETLNIKLFNNNSKWFKNLTNKDFPEDISSFLSLGPKFALNATSNDVPIAVLLSQVENIIQALPSDQQDLYRARVTNIITNSYLSNAPRWSRLSTLASLYKKKHVYCLKITQIY